MRYLFAIFLLLCSFSSYSQGVYTPVNTYSYRVIDRLDIKYGKILPIPHTAIKPYNKKLLAAYGESMYYSNIEMDRTMTYNVEYLMNDNTEWLDTFDYKRRAFLKIFYPEAASMLAVNTKAFTLRFNPLIQVAFGQEIDGEFLFTNVRGVELRAYLKKRLGFYLYIGENQLRFPSFMRDERVVTQWEHVPGEGYYKAYKETGLDFFSPRGYITFNVLDHIDFQFGYDKNFIGNGYRSLFLSDNSAPYLFLKMNTNVWRINYQSIFAELIGQYDRGGDQLIGKKYAAFHHLNFNVTHFLDIGFFEGVIFTRSDHFELHYLNPLIFYRSIEQSLGSPDNAVIGGDYKVNLFNTLSIYGQIILDEFNFEHIRARDGWWANKFGIQQGLKYLDVGRIQHLDVQLEYNVMRPYMYVHNSGTGRQIANYSHYNQSLTHPHGANFREFIGILSYQPIPKLYMELQYINSIVGTDTSDSNWGSDILKPTNGGLVEREFDNFVGQGVAKRIHFVNFIASYQFWHNMFVDANITYRKLNSDLNEQDKSDFWFHVGIRMNVPYRRYHY